MKQLKRLKNMISGGEESEKQKDKQSDEEMKTEETETKTEETKEKTTKKASKRKAKKSAKEKAEKADAKTKKDTKTEKPVDKTEKTSKSEVKKPQKPRSDSMSLFEGRDVDTITRSNITDDFKQAVIDAGAESLAICFQCGTCTGACPSGRRTPYRVRQLVRRSLMGLKEELLADDTIWMCSTCYECQERCPREIKIVDIVKIVRNYASQAGYMAKAHKMTGSFVIKTGHGVPINDATKELRKRVGLSELPPTTHEFPEALEEVQTILKTTKFDSLIGYNWESGEIE
ncbi:MAG: CoB--CoM heterodisulfide reductase subunit C [Methanobacterium sp.]|jgi:heterodisulfide reductase subunit C|nr:CoB--CoM heterodisulfide reductase subunit C [Methanobacterium sp.]